MDFQFECDLDIDLDIDLDLDLDIDLDFGDVLDFALTSKDIIEQQLDDDEMIVNVPVNKCGFKNPVTFIPWGNIKKALDEKGIPYDQIQPKVPMKKVDQNNNQNNIQNNDQNNTKESNQDKYITFLNTTV